MLFLRTLLLSGMLLAFTHQTSGQIRAIPIHELTDSIRLHPKRTLILISTGWCTYCQIQKAQLKRNRDFQAASANFYFSEFDAETEEAITFNDTMYVFQRTGVGTGMHELAYSLGNIDNRLAFPTWILIDEHFNILFRYPGVLDRKSLTKLAAYLRP